ncbi:hypothetical protein AVEN_182524-1 [Araneus ventricosus]|uniref:Uncharacterized protein n=1 Tax=Araneus ventricosus TaxID=182803 RepID=A0A4Y2C0Q2_ARAVE|nr:hypothetical protein AVEN_182524-1 [Araneus ventricosus]
MRTITMKKGPNEKPPTGQETFQAFRILDQSNKFLNPLIIHLNDLSNECLKKTRYCSATDSETTTFGRFYTGKGCQHFDIIDSCGFCNQRSNYTFRQILCGLMLLSSTRWHHSDLPADVIRTFIHFFFSTEPETMLDFYDRS